jgi:hypothetical protein
LKYGNKENQKNLLLLVIKSVGLDSVIGELVVKLSFVVVKSVIISVVITASVEIRVLLVVVTDFVLVIVVVPLIKEFYHYS